MEWSRINDRIFEEIAYAYATDIYKEYDWQVTSHSWDGNKDAFFRAAIEPLRFFYKGWCEAKYTESPGRSIPKSHMDSTLVSSILDGEVIFILFVTNGKITPSFVQRACAILTPYKINAKFVEGNVLIDWLNTRPDLLEKHFHDVSSASIPTNLEVDVIDSCFLNAIKSAPALLSSLLKLEVNKEYFLYLNLYANMNAKISLELNTNVLKPIPDDGNPEYELFPGYNSYLIRYIAKFPWKNELILSIFEDDQLVFRKKILDLMVEEDDTPSIVYSEQQATLQKLYDCTKTDISNNIILQITGKEGNGKTYLLQMLLASITNKYNAVMIVDFSEKVAENASSLCKLILFINFGFLYDLSDEAFTALIKSYTNLPFEIFWELREGTKNQITALNVIKKIIELLEKNSCALFPSFNNITAHNISCILIDDFHKISIEHAGLCGYILEEFVSRCNSQILIIGNRPGEFYDNDLEKVLMDKRFSIWNLSGISVSDVYSSIQLNFNHEISRLIDLFPVPISVLHLDLLIRKLRDKKIHRCPKEKRGVLFAEAYNETNINNHQFALSKIRNCKYLKILYVIYKVESGVPVYLLQKFYGKQYSIYSSYFAKDLLIKEDSTKLFPYHDIYVYAFEQIEFSDIYMDELNQFLQFCIKEDIDNPDILSNILSILIARDNPLRVNYLDLAREICTDYYSKSQYIAALNLAIVLLPEFELTPNSAYKYEDLELLYIYAQSEKYSSTHVGSSKYFQKIADIGAILSLNSQQKGVIYEVHSELITNYLYSLEFSLVEKELKYFEKNLKGKTNITSSLHEINAYLNFLNRNILHAFFTDDLKLKDTYQFAYNESKRLERADYQGYADMDYGKILIFSNPEKALALSRKALPIFSAHAQCAKRRIDCSAGIIFLQYITENKSYDTLFDLQKEALEKKYIHVYARITLLLLTLEIMNNESPDIIETKLIKLFIDYADLRGNNRLALFSNQLFTAIYYLRGDYKKQREYASKQLKLASILSESYLIAPSHNENNLDSNKMVWINSNESPDESCLWMDPRIW